ncbi:MAG: methyltransferase [Myxococcales bacterium]|nr:methyltransferase [Myxococcales bacterium]
MDAIQLILENTVLARPFLCPEIRLHLITEACPLWRAREPDLQRLGLADPFWGFCWAGGQALARYLLDRPHQIRGRTVLDVGCGGGVEAIAAARAGASRVIAVDTDPLAAETARLNAAENGVVLETLAVDPLERPWPDVEVVLVGDLFYEEAFARRLLGWLGEQAGQGKEVLVGDPDRGHFPGAAGELLAEYRVPADVDLGGSHLRRAGVYRMARSNPPG